VPLAVPGAGSGSDGNVYVKLTQWLRLRSLAGQRTLDTGRRHFECAK